LHQVNRKNFEGLAVSGALDCFSPITRSQYLDTIEEQESTFIEQLIKFGNKIQYERSTPQQNLFGEASSIAISKPLPPEVNEWDDSTKCKREKELIGIYLTSHPLDRYKVEIDSFCPNTLHELTDLQRFRGRDLIFCGMVKTVKDGVDQWRNKPYMLAQLEDYTETYNLRLKNDDYVNFKQYFLPDVALMIKATVNEWSPRDEPNRKIYSLKLKSVYMLADIREKLVKSVNISVNISKITSAFIDEIEHYTITENGKLLKFSITDPESNLKLNLFSRKKHVRITDEFIDYLQNNTALEFSLT
jgi:DNA polymerase-3 subunit alpha